MKMRTQPVTLLQHTKTSAQSLTLLQHMKTSTITHLQHMTCTVSYTITVHENKCTVTLLQHMKASTQSVGLLKSITLKAHEG